MEGSSSRGLELSSSQIEEENRINLDVCCLRWSMNPRCRLDSTRCARDRNNKDFGDGVENNNNTTMTTINILSIINLFFLVNVKSDTCIRGINSSTTAPLD